MWRRCLAVALAADRRLNAGLCQALGVADRNVLRAAIRMMDQTGIPPRLASIERLLQRIQNEIGAYRTTDAPADDPAGKDTDDEGDIDKTCPGGNVGEIRDPELIRPVCLELPIDPIQRTRCRGVAEGGSHRLAAPHAPQAKASHQAFDGAAGDLDAFALQLPPDLVSTIHLEVGLPDALNVGNQKFITPGSGTAQ